MNPRYDLESQEQAKSPHCRRLKESVEKLFLRAAEIFSRPLEGQAERHKSIQASTD